MTTINLFTPRFDPRDSYGRIASELITRWERDGVRVNKFGLEHEARADEYAKQPLQLALGGVVLGYPTTIPQLPLIAQYGRRIVHTMFESTRLPAGWVDVLNTLDGVSVPSEFCRDLFVTEGVRVPVEVHPLGVDTRIYGYVPREERDAFKVVAIADRGQRKGGHFAVQAFQRAFGDDPTAQLCLKCRKGSGSLIVKALRNGNKPDNIQIVEQDMGEHELARFYGEADVMLFLSMGEGFGLPPREFAATGGIALVTDWSGMSDDVHDWAIPVNVRRMVPAWIGDVHDGCGEWAEPDVEHAAHWLRLLRDADVHFRNRMGMMARTVVRKRYSWDTFAAQLCHLYAQESEKVKVHA